jgi:hypothetical protein
VRNVNIRAVRCNLIEVEFSDVGTAASLCVPLRRRGTGGLFSTLSGAEIFTLENSHGRHRQAGCDRFIEV